MPRDSSPRLILPVASVGSSGAYSALCAGATAVPPEDAEGRSFRESPFKTVPMFVSLALVVMMGTWIPLPVAALLDDAVRLLGGVR